MATETTERYPEGYEAVKIVNGVEVDSVDPLIAVTVTDDSFVMNNGPHNYEEPREEYDLWVFRPMRLR